MTWLVVAFAGQLACFHSPTSTSDRVLDHLLRGGAEGGSIGDARILESAGELEERLQGGRRGAPADLRDEAPSRLLDCIRRSVGHTFDEAFQSRHATTWRFEESPRTDEASIPLREGSLRVRIDPVAGAVTAVRLPDGRTVDDLVERCERERTRTSAERDLAAAVDRIAAELMAAFGRDSAEELLAHIAPPGLLCGDQIIDRERMTRDLRDPASALAARVLELRTKGPGKLTDWQVGASPRSIEIVLAFGQDHVSVEVWRSPGSWIITAGLLCARRD